MVFPEIVTFAGKGRKNKLSRVKTLLLGNTWLFIVIIKWILLIHIFFFTIVTLQLTLPDVLQYLSISPIVVHIFASYLHVYWNKPGTIAIAR